MARKLRRRPNSWVVPPYLIALRSRRTEIAGEIKLIKERLATLEGEELTIQQILGA